MTKKTRKFRKIYFFLCVIILAFIIAFFGTKFEKPFFTKDSLDNPQDINDSRTIGPTLLEGSSDIEVLLVHGLGATAWETKKLAEYLNSKNMTTYQVLLAGHGTSIYDLEKSKSTEWYQSVQEAYNSMQKPKKFVIGESLGSLLALELSEKNKLDGVILLSAPITFKDKRIKYTPFLMYFRRYYNRGIDPSQRLFYYENFPTKAIAEMVKYIGRIKKILPRINTSILIVQSKNDPRIDSQSAQYVYDSLGSEKKGDNVG